MFPFHLIEEEVRKYVEDTHVHEMLEEIPVNVDWDYYLDLGNNGWIVCAFDQAGIIGIAGFQISEDPNNKDILQADNVIFSVSKKHRGSVSAELIEKSKEFLKEARVAKVNFLLGDEKLGKFLSRKGFRPIRTEWSFDL